MSSTTELSLFSYEILGLVGRDGRGRARPAAAGAARPHARLGGREPVLRRAQAPREARLPRGAQGAGQDARAHRLHADRARGSKRSASTRARPSRFTPLKSEPLLRLMICDLVGEAVTRESMATLRDDIADLARAARRRREDSRHAPPPEQVPAPRDPLPAPVPRPAPRARRRGRARADRGHRPKRRMTRSCALRATPVNVRGNARWCCCRD